MIPYFVKHFLLITATFFVISAFSQNFKERLTRSIIVKTNLTNLLAQRPTFTIEKPFSKTFSAEISFVQGEVNNFLFTDHYDYSGILIRARKYFTDLNYGEVSPYAAWYIGNLKRNIYSKGYVDNTGFFSYPNRNFSAASVRTGCSLGLAFIGKKKFVADGMLGLGFGKYTKYYKPDTKSKGYFDCQIWLSIGYCL